MNIPSNTFRKQTTIVGKYMVKVFNPWQCCIIVTVQIDRADVVFIFYFIVIPFIAFDHFHKLLARVSFHILVGSKRLDFMFPDPDTTL